MWFFVDKNGIKNLTVFNRLEMMAWSVGSRSQQHWTVQEMKENQTQNLQRSLNKYNFKVSRKTTYPSTLAMPTTSQSPLTGVFIGRPVYPCPSRPGRTLNDDATSNRFFLSVFLFLSFTCQLPTENSLFCHLLPIIGSDSTTPASKAFLFLFILLSVMIIHRRKVNSSNVNSPTLDLFMNLF